MTRAGIILCKQLWSTQPGGAPIAVCRILLDADAFDAFGLTFVWICGHLPCTRKIGIMQKSGKNIVFYLVDQAYHCLEGIHCVSQ